MLINANGCWQTTAIYSNGAPTGKRDATLLKILDGFNVLGHKHLLDSQTGTFNLKKEKIIMIGGIREAAGMQMWNCGPLQSLRL